DPSGKRSVPASRKKPSTGYQTITKAFNLDLNAPREQAIANRLIKSFDRNVFQRLVAEWIVESNLSFREPENKRLRAIFEYLNPFVVSTDAHVGHDTVRKRAVAEFEKHKGKARKLILGVPELTVRHFGANIGHEIIEILESYEISEEKIGYFTLDNAQNNDTAMDTIGERFKFHGKERRGPTAEHELWRKRSPVGKLHNLVVAIHRSDLLTTLLRSIQRLGFDASEDPRVRIRKPLNVVVDNETRWLSHLYMIRRALKLRPYLETLDLKHKQEWDKDNTSKRSKRPKASAIMPAICRDENKLGDKDWAVLEAFGDILQSFEDAVKALEGDGIQWKRKQGYFESYGNVWDVIVGYEFLLAELEKAKAMVNQYPEPEHFKVNINLGWKRLDEYYNKLDETDILHLAGTPPRLSLGLFRDGVVWTSGVDFQGERCAAKSQRTQYYSPFERYKDEARIRPCEEMDSDNVEDEYARWQKDVLPTDNVIRDPLEYWHAQRFKYPRLSRMAVDFMTVQPMSAECERLFSAAERMVTPLRNQLEASTIAICQVLRSWLQAGIVEEVDPMLLDKVDDTMGEDSVEKKSVSEWLRDLPMQMREEETGWE
ncbi:restless-like transposase, partial [Fusarium beomiforme]